MMVGCFEGVEEPFGFPFLGLGGGQNDMHAHLVILLNIPMQRHIWLWARAMGMDKIETPKISEILREEFMVPLGISAYRLAKDTGVPVSRVQDILHDRRKITADTSIRLGRYFGISERYFLNLQMDVDIREAEAALEAERQD